MEGDAMAGLNTLQCLRGRLLAERHASKVAKQDAQLLGNKLIEIENKLNHETKLRLKAQKKLKLLMHKLHSLNLSPTLELQLTLSEISSSSSSTSSGPEDQPAFTLDDVSGASTSLPIILGSKSTHHFPAKKDSRSWSKLETTAVEMEKEKDVEDNADNSMALVPVTVTTTTKSKIVNKSVGEVLDALRHAREKIRSSIQSKSTITPGTA